MKSIIAPGKFLIITWLSCFIWLKGICQTMPDLKNATPAQRAQYQTTMMKSKLKLDSGQITKVQAINLKYAQKFEPIIKGSDSRMSKFRAAKALQESKDKELQAVFSKDQFRQYQDFESEMKSKMKARMQKD